MKNADEIKFRCSSLGYIMIDPRSKSETLSEGCKTHCVDVFVSAMYGRKEEAFGKMLDKGNEREQDSITLLSRVSKTFYKKNDVRLDNEFISGECDLFLGKSVKKATETIDTKTSWSAHTFFRSKNKELDKMYYWQGVGYMYLTGAKKHTVAYCLVNGTASAILDEKRKLSYSMGIIDDSSRNNPEYIEMCQQIEINHIFDIKSFQNENQWFEFDNDLENWKWDIPMDERVHLFSFDRQDSEIEKLNKRILDCKKWMNENLFKSESIDPKFIAQAKEMLAENDYAQKIARGKELLIKSKI